MLPSVVVSVVVSVVASVDDSVEVSTVPFSLLLWVSEIFSWFGSTPGGVQSRTAKAATANHARKKKVRFGAV